MAARGGDDQGALNGLLAPHLGEVDRGLGRVEQVRDIQRRVRLKLEVAGEQADNLGERGDADGVDARHDSGLGNVLAWDDHAAVVALPGEGGHGDDALDRAHPPVEGELAREEEVAGAGDIV